MKFTYQHTCKSSQQAHLLKNAPFKSTIKKYGNKSFTPFLGAGYYFWEENREAAVDWGKRQYDNKYGILEYVDLQLDDNFLLDLLNRRHLSYFNELRDKYIKARPESKEWRLGVWIEFFKKLYATEPAKFPYKYFRADENFPEANQNADKKQRIYFTNGQYYYTYLNPLFIICMLDKKDINCTETILVENKLN